MGLKISASVRQKLAEKHRVAEEEIIECFANRDGEYLVDDREDHRSDPQTLWFIAQTNFGRPLKVCFIPRGTEIHIRTAYQPNQTEVDLYDKVGK